MTPIPAGDVIRVAGNLPPLNWAIPMGEFAHARRTSLDNLLWALIIRRGGTPVPLVTQFPIYENDAMIRPALPGVADWTPPR